MKLFTATLCFLFFSFALQAQDLILLPNIRIGTDFELITEVDDAWKTYITTQLIPAVTTYLEAALKIKYPSTSLIQSTVSSLCGFTTPDALKTGIDADIVIFFNSANDTNGSWMAATSLCQMTAGAVKRPQIVNIGINAASIGIADPISNPLVHDLYINVLVHEFVHALGMNGPLYNYFVDSEGNLLTNHIKSVTLSGIKRTVLDLPPLTQMLRNYTGCDTIPGLFMENNGGAHIERRFFQWEIMTTGGIVGSKISFITLGFLEGTGWYVPDYSYAEPYHFGEGEGCGFYADTINSTDFPNEYCTGNGIDCTEVGNGGGYCVSDSLIEVGRVVTAQYSFNCENPAGVYYTPFSSKQVYGRGLNSKCFSGNLTTYTSKQVSQTSYCLSATCEGSDADAIINFKWGTTSLQCTAAGPLQVSGYQGFINCPDPVRFCRAVGKQVCPRNCMGRGSCVDGQCVCEAGFQGTDCGFTMTA